MLGIDQTWLLASPFPPSVLGQCLLLGSWCLGQAGVLALLPQLLVSLSQQCLGSVTAVLELPLMG